jgi:HEAT repeat protein
MARATRLEDALAALREAAASSDPEPLTAEAKKVLGHRSCHAVAKAAQLAGERGLSGVVAELLVAFDRFLVDPGSDKGCVAKAAIAEALYHLGHDDPAVFLRGIRHVQMEPVFGGRVDTAVDLRGACALGLVRLGYRGVMVELADLLADPEPPARISAARAIAYRGGEDGAPLLRLKARLGDKEPRVTAECLSALVRVAPSASLPFVAAFLDSSDGAVAEGAAMALGESRCGEALGLLKSWSDRTVDGERRRAALLAIAMLRREEAFEHLMQLVREGPLVAACDAIRALAIYKQDDAIHRRAAEAAAARNEPAVRQAIERVFGAA